MKVGRKPMTMIIIHVLATLFGVMAAHDESDRLSIFVLKCVGYVVYMNVLALLFELIFVIPWYR